MDSRNKPRFRPKAERRKSARTQSERMIIESLASELYGVIFRALREFGLSSADQVRLRKYSAHKSQGTPASNQVLRRFNQLGDLIAAWHSDTKYLDLEGKPRILPIEGPGATYGALARKFLPGMAANDAVQLACRAAEVGTLPSGKIALYGSTLVNIAKNAESALAQSICHIAWLTQTCVHNFNASQSERERGRIERITGRMISIDDFDAFQRQIRPQIHDLCERVDGMLLPLERRTLRQRKRLRAVGMGIYLYADESVIKVRRIAK
jgi:hypothetical protein